MDIRHVPEEVKPLGENRDHTADDRDVRAEADDRASDRSDARAQARDDRAEARDELHGAVDAGAADDRAAALRDRQRGASDRDHAAGDRKTAASNRGLSAQELITALDQIIELSKTLRDNLRNSNYVVSESQAGRDPISNLFCECGQPKCHEKLSMDPSDYDSVRVNDTWYIVMTGHEVAGADQVVQTLKGCNVVELLQAA